MRRELVFTVGQDRAENAKRMTLAEAGLKERSHLQEWIKANPEILGEGILIITSEFDRWVSGSGNHSDRLDLLGLDADGRLVVAELKRDGAPDFVASQAIRYAAYASRFDLDTIASCYGDFLRSSGEVVTNDGALERLEQHCGGLDVDLLRSPRIVLVAGEFPEPVTASVVWLCEQGLDITLIQTAAYKAEHDLVLTVSQVWPLAAVEDFTISPRASEVRTASTRNRASRNAVSMLVELGLPLNGARLTLNPSGKFSKPVENWAIENPSRLEAIWRPDHSVRALEWEGDRWSASGLAEHIIRLAAPGSNPSVNGALWWVTEDGFALADLAGTSTGSRDWSDLHELLGHVHRGEWVSYGELATAVSSAALAVGRHISQCDTCPNGWRVMGADGSSRPGFHFSDSLDNRGQQEVLESEGVRFIGHLADPSCEVKAADLEIRSAAAGIA